MSRFKERFERRVDPRGNVYYWLTGETPIEDRVPDADAVALKDDRITITPISYDLTCGEEVERLRTCPLPDLKTMFVEGA
jgi:5'-nucleotidase